MVEAELSKVCEANGSFLDRGLCDECMRHNLAFAADSDSWMCDFSRVLRIQERRCQVAKLLEVADSWEQPVFGNLWQVDGVRVLVCMFLASPRLRVRRRLLALILTGRPYGFKPMTLALTRACSTQSQTVLNNVIAFVV